MTSIHVKPAEGLVVRAPDGSIIPPEGAHLVLDFYLTRRLAEGDLVLVPEAPATARKKGIEA